jgi:hypothetical protein
MKFRLIEVERAQHSVSLLCGVLGVTRAGFYAWKRRPTSQRELRERELCRLIGKAFTDSRETHGAPRIRAELENGHGLRISSKRVARLMRRLGIQGVSRRGKRPVTTKRAEPAPAASDLLRRRFQAPGPDRLWVADITYVPTWKGYLFLAAVLDPSYGAGVARFLALEGIELIEVTRVARHGRRHLGKSDARDAGAAAQVVLSGRATAQPKPRNGTVESIGCCATRASAVKSRSQAGLQLRNLILTAPDQLREPLTGLTTKQAVVRCASMRRSERLDAVAATRKALLTLARRCKHSTPKSASSTATSKLTPQAAPRLLAQPGIGPDTAAKLLVVAGDNPDRCAPTPP